jgi:hypothetical protein
MGEIELMLALFLTIALVLNRAGYSIRLEVRACFRHAFQT